MSTANPGIAAKRIRLQVEIDGKTVAFSESETLRHKWNTKGQSGTRTSMAIATDTVSNRGLARISI